MSEKRENDEIKKDKRLVETAFLFLGIGSLLPWNAIISVFDFFIYYQKDQQPDKVFPIINFVFNLSVQIILLCSKNLLSYKNQLFLSQYLSVIGLILFPLVVTTFVADISYKISCGIMVFIGIANALASSSIFGLASFFPVNNIIAVGTGQGFAGIILNLLRYVILFFFSEQSQSDINIGAYLFFGVSGILMIICIIYSCLLYKSKYFNETLKSKQEVVTKPPVPEETEGKLLDNNRNSINDNEDDAEQEEKEIPKKKEEFSFFRLMIKLADINILCAMSFALTFMLFPGACIKPGLFNLSIGWKINTIIFLFNLFDTIAKSLTSYLTPSKFKLYFFSIIRLGLIGSFYYTAYAEFYQTSSSDIISYLAIINVILLSMTSGFVNCYSFALAPGQVEDEWKGKAGSSVSLSLVIGICSGTFLGIVFNNLTTFPALTGKN